MGYNYRYPIDCVGAMLRRGGSKSPETRPPPAPARWEDACFPTVTPSWVRGGDRVGPPPQLGSDVTASVRDFITSPTNWAHLPGESFAYYNIMRIR